MYIVVPYGCHTAERERETLFTKRNLLPVSDTSTQTIPVGMLALSGETYTVDRAVCPSRFGLSRAQVISVPTFAADCAPRFLRFLAAKEIWTITEGRD